MADIDFANADSRMKFLQENMTSLMNGIDANYGQILMDELMKRLEQTVSEFNEEVKIMLNKLQDKAKEAEIPDFDAAKSESTEIDLESSGLSEFEKRLEALDS
ncbi:MAG: hypothetical protein K9M49_07905 [Candidatus Marinimicrobia bacterium]|nr:hypothetical protein [Candidatus Neomarinimicrobiota bacterium]MCF7851343.1 hypothetical protein [Candidatus Neomarinimicrobiota bacterium]MCF7905063.1 hypothetical protein [Candidatus Neomarinimicrobiota bacterium]